MAGRTALIVKGWNTRCWTPRIDSGPLTSKTGIMGKKLFGDLTFGTRFTLYGKTYIKIALNMAEDEKRNGNIFQSETEVEPIEYDMQLGRPEIS
jgi:hypothetical protein